MTSWRSRREPPSELDAFTALHHGRLVGTLWLYCGDRDLAEELAQETLVRVCRDWEQVSRMAAPGAWAHRVAINLANSHFRRRGAARRAFAKVQADALDAHLDPDTAAGVAVRRAIARLNPKQRSVVVLRYYADLPLQDIADSLGLSLSAVKSLHHRATKALQSALGEHTPGPGIDEENLHVH
ncbi:MAG: SigE family RNA polymerase sigma factor [Actinobacteria bacterium]|nr:SigE family RNA polymerase sigma factor [Actinomycetota bacterium]